jgi:hypothetical protein
MSEQAFEWKLSPTERRIAEVAFAMAHEASPRWCAHTAMVAVRRFRGLDNQLTEGERAAQADALLAELRREPEAHGSEWRTALEWALGLEPDAENHTPEWAASLVREIREIGNRR